MKILLNILIITILSINLSSADELQVFDFTESELTELQVRKVRGADNKTVSWAQKEGSWKVTSKKTRKAKAQKTWPLWRALDAAADLVARHLDLDGICAARSSQCLLQVCRLGRAPTHDDDQAWPQILADVSACAKLWRHVATHPVVSRRKRWRHLRSSAR